jgi:hypothetical protein
VPGETPFRGLRRSSPGGLRLPSFLSRRLAHLSADSRRSFQVTLGLVWLLDAGLQFQPFMYSNGFTQLIDGNAAAQPHWLGDTISWAGNLAGTNLAVFNTLFALTQVIIGVGLLWRRTVKPALALSIVWALIVWWAGEGFGFLLAGTGATHNPLAFMTAPSPLLGAPGPGILYALI